MVELLNTREFSKRVGVVPETIRDWVRLGKLKPHGRTLGGHHRFHPDQVHEVLDAPRQETERAGTLAAQVQAALAKFEQRRDRRGQAG